jgi:spermidine synthase
MLCHGELVRLKPHPAYLTSFYLTLAAGGAAGGLFVGVVAPLVFPTYVELPLGLVGCTVLILVVFYRDCSWALSGGRPRWAWGCLLFGLVALVCFQADLFVRSLSGVQEIHRNFYGVTRVKMEPVMWAEKEFVFKLIHGRTMHGEQFASEKRRLLPTAYYGEKSGVGLILRSHRRGEGKRVGVVGLGIGTLAAYGEPGDTYRFYEINPDMIDLAKRFFAYLDTCQADWEIVEGDARMSLEEEPSQRFDVLVLDAFSSDAVPIHLLTHEAFKLYLRHLKPDGVLAVHASNVHLDLRRVTAGHAESFDLEVASVLSPAETKQGTTKAVWELLSRAPASLQLEAIQQAKLRRERQSVFWTDKRNSLFQVLMKGGRR